MSDRPTIRETTGVALNSSQLAFSEVHRTAADFVAALGNAPTLGTYLWRLKYAGEDHLLFKTLELFAKYIWKQPGKPKKHIVQLCKMALEEWSIDMCLSCNGQGHHGRREGLETQKVNCDECHGRKYLNGKKCGRNGVEPVQQLCSRCSGNGFRFESIKVQGEKHRVCQVCNGTSRYVRTDSERAQAMELKGCNEPIQVGAKAHMTFKMSREQEFTTYWWAKYSKILGQLQRLDRQTNAIVKQMVN